MTAHPRGLQSPKGRKPRAHARCPFCLLQPQLLFPGCFCRWTKPPRGHGQRGALNGLRPILSVWVLEQPARFCPPARPPSGLSCRPPLLFAWPGRWGTGPGSGADPAGGAQLPAPACRPCPRATGAERGGARRARCPAPPRPARSPPRPSAGGAAARPARALAAAPRLWRAGGWAVHPPTPPPAPFLPPLLLPLLPSRGRAGARGPGSGGGCGRARGQGGRARWWWWWWCRFAAGLLLLLLPVGGDGSLVPGSPLALQRSEMLPSGPCLQPSLPSPPPSSECAAGRKVTHPG